MKKLKKAFKRVFQNERGQGATEYILLLVVVVAIAMIFRAQIKQIVSDKIGEVGGAIGTFNVNE